ncbi:hypothetical protein [Bradyrhizobium sp. DOA9]|nr:hypothetical protein [Bradyrhizobium sp. DOA9]
MEPKKKPDQPATELEQPTLQQVEEQPSRNLPFANEGLEQVRDSHC